MTDYYIYVGNPHDGVPDSFTLAEAEAVDWKTGEPIGPLYTWNGDGGTYRFDVWDGPTTGEAE